MPWTDTAPALALAVALAAGAHSEGQQPVFRVGADLVVVEVQVVDRRGTPIPGLEAADFEVTIDREPRQVTSVEFVGVGSVTAGEGRSTAGGGAPAPQTDSRPGDLYVLAVDESSFSAWHAPAAVRAARRFLEKLPAEHKVGVYAYPHGRGLDITSNRADALARLSSVMGALDAPTSEYNLGMSEVIDITARDADTARRVAARECPTAPFMCVKQIEQEAASLAMAFERQVSESVAGLRLLLRALAAVPGRKVLVVVSGGLLTSDRVGGRPDVATLVGDVSREAAESNVTLYVLHMDSSFIDKFSAKASGARVPYMSDSTALGSGLERLAANGGGTLFRIEAGNGDFAFDRVLLETSAHYLLYVEPGEADRDGRPHRIEVRVRARRADVRSRTTVVIPRSRLLHDLPRK